VRDDLPAEDLEAGPRCPADCEASDGCDDGRPVV